MENTWTVQFPTPTPPRPHYEKRERFDLIILEAEVNPNTNAGAPPAATGLPSYKASQIGIPQGTC